MNLSTFIANTDFFNGLPEDCCRMIAEHVSLQSIDKGTMLFSEGEEGHIIYILASGMIRLSKMTEDGAESVVRLIKPGDMFAEVILFESSRYPVTATAIAPSQVAGIHCVHIHSLLENRSFRTHFIAHLFRKQRQLTSRLQELTSLNIRDRFFLFLRSHFGTTDTMHITLSKKEMAAAIGITPESFSRLIKQLKEGQFIKWQGKELIILCNPLSD